MSGDALQRVLAALENAGSRWRHQSGGYTAQCPAHEDNNPSLSIKNGDGKVLLDCKAHCQTSDVLTALGLVWADLFDTNQDERPAQRPTISATYDYHDATGTVLYQKVRYLPKDFRVRRPDGYGGWVWNIGDDTPRVLYRLPEVLAAIGDGVTVHVVEGEKDVDRLTGLGHVATCNYDGASKDTQRPKWRDSYSDTLIGAHVVIIADNDAAGFAHARAALASLTGKTASAKIMRGAVDTEHADASDHLAAGWGLADLIPVLNGDKPATGKKGNENLSLNPDATPSFADLYQPIDWHELWNTTTAEPDWLVPGIIERGRLHAIYAPRKHKKSLITLILVAELASGRSLLGRPNHHEQPIKILYIDIENAQDDIRQRLQDAGYGPDDLTNLIYLSFPSLPGLDSPVGGQHLMSLVEHYQPDLVVLDTTSRVVTGAENDADTFRALYRHALAPIKAAGTAILRLDHAGKDLTLGQRGSSAKGDDLDTAWIITMPSWDRITLRLDFQRTNHHPQEIELVQHSDPLRFMRIDAAHDKPEVTALIVQLDRLGVPSDAGRDACRRALADAGVKTRNDLLTEAIKIRKATLGNSGFRRSDLSPDLGDRSPKGSTQTGDSAGQTCPGQKITETITPRSTTPVPKINDNDYETPGQTCPGQVGDSGDRSQWADKGRPVPGTVYEVADRGQAARAEPTDDAADPGGDRWVHAHLTTRPQTIARLVTDLDATTSTVETALCRLEATGLAQCHTQPGKPDGWSLPLITETRSQGESL